MSLTSREAKVHRLNGGHPPRVLDLFSGCGGFSLGFHAAGFDILAGIEKDPKAAKTYANNFFREALERRKLHAESRDITETPPRELLRGFGHPDPAATIDTVLAGPPCQSYARIGRAKLRAIAEDPQAFLRDRRGRLYTHLISYVDALQPLVVVFENVLDLLNHGGKNVAEEICTELSDLNYDCRYTILNAAHYGVPQLRERVFILAFARELEVEPCFPVPTHRVDLPPGYLNARTIALRTKEHRTDNHPPHYARAPGEPDDLYHRAISARRALGDLPSVTRHLEGQLGRGPRRFDTLSRYRDTGPVSHFARKMRKWEGFESSDGVWDHVIRYLPRDYPIFSQMRPGDQYPQAHQIALDLFEERVEAKRRQGEDIEEGDPLYKQLRKGGVNPVWWTYLHLNPPQPSEAYSCHELVPLIPNSSVTRSPGARPCGSLRERTR